jgi:PPOX class probable F420-dependent enzyme
MAELTQKAKDLIDGKNFANVATLMPDGSPQISTTWVDRDGDKVIINTTEGRVKTRNIKRDPRIAISIFKSDDPYDAVFIRGKVLEVKKDGAEEHIDKLAHKYIGMNYREHGDRVMFIVDPEHIFATKS